jgi:hypothetical protein
MIGQDRINNIINQLKIISGLTPGKTLSTSTMTIIDHNTWSGSAWRTYAGENRKQTIMQIKAIFTEALSIIKLSSNRENNKDVVISIEMGLYGVNSLKETYKDDYYIISEIDDMINNIRHELEEICRQLMDPYSKYTEIYVSEGYEDKHYNEHMKESYEDIDIKSYIECKKESLKQRREDLETRKKSK